MSSLKAVHVFKLQESLVHLRRLLPNTKFIHLDDIEKATDNPDVEILIGHPKDVGPLLYACPNLKWCQSILAGANLIVDHCKKMGHPPNAVITRFAGFLPLHMAEWVIGRMVEYERSFEATAKNQRNGYWDQMNYAYYRTLYDLSIGIIGFGDIGQTIAKRCKAFDMTVYGVGRSERTEIPDYTDGYRSVANKDEVLTRCDYICSVLPATSETDGIFDNDYFKAFSEKKPVFINIGRGNVVSEESIIKALDQGWIRHAILDVYYEEPLPPNSKLWHDERVTISPHVSGFSMTNEISQVFAENYQRYISGKPLQYVVNLEKGY